MESVLSNLFFIQIGTSGLCMCGSIYCLAFVNLLNFVTTMRVSLIFVCFFQKDLGDNLLERLTQVIIMTYFVSEIFMITYLGNEITVSSSYFMYNIFRSNWIEQPLSTKKDIIIFCEHLKQPQKILIGKLYPLTLETFVKVYLTYSIGLRCSFFLYKFSFQISYSTYTMFNALKNLKN